MRTLNTLKLRKNQKKQMNLCALMQTSLLKTLRKTKRKGMPLVKDLQQGSFTAISDKSRMRKTTQAMAAIPQ